MALPSLAAIIFFLNGILTIIKIAFKKNHSTGSTLHFSSAIINIIVAFVLNFIPNSLFVPIFPIFFAIYTLFNGIVKLIVCVLYLRNSVKGAFLILFESIIFIVFGIIFLFYPIIHINEMLIIVGLYCILYSFSFYFDAIREILPNKSKNRIKRSFRVSLPLFMVGLIPRIALTEANEYFNTVSSDEQSDEPDYEEKTEDYEPELEIFIHVTEAGFGAMGHDDLAYKGIVYSYGNYDDSSLRLFETVGDGVLFTTEKSKYIPFCIEKSQKTLFSFGLKLTDLEQENIEKYLHKVMEETYEWHTPFDAECIKNKNANKDDFTDYSSDLSKTMPAKFFKFKKGKFKTYFVLGTNCVLLADSVIGKSGTDVVKFNGIISPGGYFEFLDREFRRSGSQVITRRIYN